MYLALFRLDANESDIGHLQIYHIVYKSSFFWDKQFSLSRVDLNSRSLQSSDDKIFILSLFDMTVSIGVTELHPYINVFFGRIITFPSQSPICLCQQMSNPVFSDGARTLIGILLKQISCDVQVILSSFSVFTS